MRFRGHLLLFSKSLNRGFRLKSAPLIERRLAPTPLAITDAPRTVPLAVPYKHSQTALIHGGVYETARSTDDVPAVVYRMRASPANRGKERAVEDYHCGEGGAGRAVDRDRAGVRS